MRGARRAVTSSRALPSAFWSPSGVLALLYPGRMANG